MHCNESKKPVPVDEEQWKHAVAALMLRKKHSYAHSMPVLASISEGACQTVYKHSYADTLCQCWRVFLRARAKLSINFEEILSRAHGNFEEQNMVLESSKMIVINYFYY